MAARRLTWSQAAITFTVILLSLFPWAHQGQAEYNQHDELPVRPDANAILTNASYIDDTNAHAARALPPKPKPDDSVLPWDAAVEIGEWLVCMMNAPLEDVEQSQYTGANDLGSYGWDINEPPVNIARYRLDDVWNDLHISDEDGDWTKMDVSHGRATQHRDSNGQLKTYIATRAQYESLYNIGGGFILSTFNYGPRTTAPRLPKNDIIPLKQWSDVTYLAWQILNTRQAPVLPAAKPDNLNHIIRYEIANDETQKRLTDVLDREDPNWKYGSPPPKWPGLKLRIDRRAAQATMNTPNAGGIAWMLSQHKQQLGTRVVDEVRIFSSKKSNGEAITNMYFHIIPKPPDHEEKGSDTETETGGP